MCILCRSEADKSQYEASPTELARRAAAHQEADRQDDIAEALELIAAIEPILSRLNLYYCGELRGLKAMLEEMR